LSRERGEEAAFNQKGVFCPTNLIKGFSYDVLGKRGRAVLTKEGGKGGRPSR